MKVKNSLISKITIGVVILVILGMTTLSTVFLNQAKNSKIELLENQLIGDSQKLGQIIDVYLAERSNEVISISESEILSSDDYSEDEKSDYLYEVINDSKGRYISSVLLNMNGDLIAKSSNENELNHLNGSWFTGALEKNGIYYEVINKSENEFAIVISNVINDENKNKIGVLSLELPFTSIDGIMNKNIEDMKNIGWDSSYNTIIDKDGIVAWHPQKSYIGKLNLIEAGGTLSEAANEMIQGKTGIKSYNFEGEDRLVAFSPMNGYYDFEGLGWSFAVVTSQTFIDDNINSLRNTMIYSSIVLVLVLSLFIALFLSVANNFPGKKILAIVLTGMGSDGLLGLKKLKEQCDCYCITQNEKSCLVYGMSKNVEDSNLSDESLELNQIIERIIESNNKGIIC